MERELFEKKLAFTIESVNNNDGHVSGIIELDSGDYVYFDDCGIVVYNKNNLILWDIAFSEDDDEDYIKMIYRLVLYNFSSKRVKRVYPDCCWSRKPAH